MKFGLETNIQYLTGVGEKTAKKLNKLGIYTIRDLLFYYPRGYKDFTKIIPIIDVISSDRRESRNLTNRRSLDYARDDNGRTWDDNGGARDDKVTIKGKILSIDNKRTSRRRFTITEAIVEDETGSIKVIWFNQSFLVKMLSVGRELILNGKVSYNWYSKEVVMESPERTLRPCIVPVYPETEGISSKFIQKLVSNSYKLIDDIEEWMPTILAKRYKLLAVGEALKELHLPVSIESIKEAQRRIAFDELFMISLRSNLAKAEVAKESAPQIKVDTDSIAEFVKNLPFELTDDQRKATWQIIKDIEGNSHKLKAKGAGRHSSVIPAEAGISKIPDQVRDDTMIMPMNRLLNGDVGSGKTVVAAIAALATVKAGYRVAIMCPTSILANQHFETFCDLLENENISIGLMTRERQECSGCHPVLDTGSSKYHIDSGSPVRLAQGRRQATGRNDTSSVLNADIIIGTQTLIQEGIDLQNIGLVIIDEQHRFGVEQRSALLKAESYKLKDGAIENDPLVISYQLSASTKKMRPHFLSMTATPIPRTLHLALFGDLDISVISEKPKNRKEIKTRFVNAGNRQKAYQFIRKQLEAGRQAFIICPLIEEKSEALNSKSETNTKSKILNNYGLLAIGDELLASDRKTVIEEAKKLQAIFPEYKIGVLHGRMKAKEKDEVMEQFSKGSINILVSTSVVEVGVDVPNATVIVIEDAERFGLAQIHQFRGRVGRAEHQSYCFLFSSTMSEKALKRLTSLEATSDGFRLAEIDLETRGPGAIFGTEQSGLLDLKMATLADRELIEEASAAAKELVQADPDLSQHPLLKDRISEYLQNKHLE